MAFFLVLGVSLGSLGILMMQHLTSGYWGIVIRRPLESATRVLPLLLILFAPIFLVPPHLWRMAQRAGHGRRRLFLNFQQHYLTASWFHIRAIAYFAVWLVLMWAFNAWSRQQDINRDDRSLRRRLKCWLVLA